MIAALLAAAAAQALLISGGPIYTGDDAKPKAEAVVVRDGRIAFVGPLKAAQAQAAGARRIDLHGAALFPGFTDSHAHLDDIGQRELTLNLEGSRSAAEVAQRLKAWLVAHPPAEGATVSGMNWIETGWPEKRFLNRHDLDAVAPPSTRVLLGRSDGHALVANTAALEAAGITRDTPDPFGGKILKDEAGEPTGMLVDNAMNLVAKLQPQPTEALRREGFAKAFEVETRYGWTGVHSMSVAWRDVALLEAMDKAGQAPLRVYNAVIVGEAGPLLASGPRQTPDGRITTRAIKIFADGALGSRGAYLFQPYTDAPEQEGLLKLKPAETLPVLKTAAARGIQVCTHAIGDKAVDTVLGLYEQAFSGAPRGREAAARWRVEHAQNVIAADIPRFAKDGVIPSMQPSHAIGDLHFAAQRLGLARLAEAYAWKPLIDAGSIVPAGSDAPVERGDPMIEFYAAVARKDLQGRGGAGWHPEYAVDRRTALKMFTAWPAYARFAENELGTISVGKRADLSAFSVDLMTAPEAAIPKAHAVLTVVDGQVVYTRL